MGSGVSESIRCVYEKFDQRLSVSVVNLKKRWIHSRKRFVYTSMLHNHPFVHHMVKKREGTGSYMKAGKRTNETMRIPARAGGVRVVLNESRKCGAGDLLPTKRAKDNSSANRRFARLVSSHAVPKSAF